MRAFDVAENVHEGGILARTDRAGGDFRRRSPREAVGIAARIADALDHVGVLAVEMFVVAGRRQRRGSSSTRSRRASTIPATGPPTPASISQFEQHIRAIAGWPLGDPDAPLRRGHDQPDRRRRRRVAARSLAEPGARLHLYGKAETRPGRKMGHVNRLWPRSLSLNRPRRF